MKADKQTKKGVLGVLDEIKASYLGRDIDGVMRHDAQDDDVIFVMTGSDEIYTGFSAIKKVIQRDFAQSIAVTIEHLSEPVVSASGTVAWLEMHGVTRIKLLVGSVKMIGRLTAILERREGHWLFVHVHLSVPALGQKKGKSFATAFRRRSLRRKKKG